MARSVRGLANTWRTRACRNVPWARALSHIKRRASRTRQPTVHKRQVLGELSCPTETFTLHKKRKDKSRKKSSQGRHVNQSHGLTEQNYIPSAQNKSCTGTRTIRAREGAPQTHGAHGANGERPCRTRERKVSSAPRV